MGMLNQFLFRVQKKSGEKKLFLVQEVFVRDKLMSYAYIYIYGVNVCIALLVLGAWCAHTVHTELILVFGAKIISSETTQTMHETHMWSQESRVRCIKTPIWGVYMHMCMVYVCAGR